jgi:hypothetical protein
LYFALIRATFHKGNVRTMPGIPDVKAQALAKKQLADDILGAMTEIASEKKQMVRAQTQDSLYIDPVTGESYKMTPIIITHQDRNVVITDGQPGRLATVFEYTVPEGAEILFPPQRGDYYMLGLLQTDDGAMGPAPINFFPVQIIVVDNLRRKTVGVAYSGTVTDVNQSSLNRARGHGTGYGGEFPVRAKNGDRIQFKVFCDTVVIGPAGQAVVRWFRMTPPTGIPISRIALRVASLSRVK